MGKKSKKAMRERQKRLRQEVTEMLAQATPKAIKRLGEMMEEELPANVMLPAIKELLDRGLGKSAGVISLANDCEPEKAPEITIRVIE